MTAERIVYADHPATGEPTAVHYSGDSPKWICFGDHGEGMQPIGTSAADAAPPPGATTRVHCGWIEITAVRA